MDLDDDNSTLDGDTRVALFEGFENDTTTFMNWEKCIMTSVYGLLIIITVVSTNMVKIEKF